MMGGMLLADGLRQEREQLVEQSHFKYFAQPKSSNQRQS